MLLVSVIVLMLRSTMIQYISVGTDSGTVANDNIAISNNDIQVLDKPEITETTVDVEPPTIRSLPKRECRMPTKYKDFVV